MTTITISDMTTNNPLTILAAMAWNALFALANIAIRLIELVTLTVLAFVATHGRLLAKVAALALAVVVAVAFWQVIAIAVGVFGGMIAGLKLVMRL